MADAPACDPFPPITKNMLIFQSCKKCPPKKKGPFSKLWRNFTNLHACSKMLDETVAHFRHKGKQWKKGLNKVKTIYLREMQKSMCMWVLILWPQVCPRCHPAVDSLVKHPKSCPRPYLCAVQSCGSADPNQRQELLLHITRKNSSKIFRFTQQQTNSEYIFISLKREIYHYGRILFVSKAPESILETQNLLHTINFQWEYNLQNYTWQESQLITIRSL